MPTNFNSLLLGGGSWHNGSQTLTYSYLNNSIPGYYNQIDTNSDNINDAYQISVGDTFPSLPFGTSAQMTAAEIALMEFAVQQLNDVANINMMQVTSGVGDLTFGSFGMTTNRFGTPDTGLYGFAYLPSGASPGSPSINGDLWINRNNPNQAVNELGHTSYNTFIHELGHALGLAHPNNDPNNVAGDPTNNNQYTVMSYVPHPGVAGLSLFNQSFGLTPMLYDIQALQQLYGVNTTTRTGNTVYFGDGLLGTGATYGESEFQYGAAGMTVENRPVVLTIWDAGGIDLIDASDQSTNVTINLAPGSFSTIGTLANNIAVAAAVSENGSVINYIENAAGGTGNDSLTGNATGNTMLGNAGNDTLSGGDGADSLVGGTQEDQLFGEDGNDTLLGNAGFDRLDGGIGDDFLDGGAQADNLFGGVGNDTLLGGNGFDRLFGQQDNDLIYGGTGPDALFGQEGNDTLVGQTGNDRLFGGIGNDVLDGGSDDDVLIGGAGFDILLGSTGNDTLTGAFNADTFVFTDFGGGFGNDVITDFDANNNFEDINLRGVSGIVDFNDLVANHMNQVGLDVVIDDGNGNTITLLNVNINDLLDNQDFIF